MKSVDILTVLRKKLEVRGGGEIVIGVSEFMLKHGIDRIESERRYWEFIDSIFSEHNLLSTPNLTLSLKKDVLSVSVRSLRCGGVCTFRDIELNFKAESVCIENDTILTAPKRIDIRIESLVIRGGGFSFDRKRGVRTLGVNRLIFDTNNSEDMVFVIECVRVTNEMMRKPSARGGFEFLNCVFNELYHYGEGVDRKFSRCVFTIGGQDFSVDAVFDNCEFHVHSRLNVINGTYRGCRYILDANVKILSIPQGSFVDFEQVFISESCRELKGLVFEGDIIFLNERAQTVFGDCSFSVSAFAKEDVFDNSPILNMSEPCRFLTKNSGLSGIRFLTEHSQHVVTHAHDVPMDYERVTEQCEIYLNALKRSPHSLSVLSFLSDAVDGFNSRAIYRLKEAMEMVT